MYFSEQGDVDDDATLITIFLVSFNLQSCCLVQSAVCKCHTPAFPFGFEAKKDGGTGFSVVPRSLLPTG